MTENKREYARRSWSFFYYIFGLCTLSNLTAAFFLQVLGILYLPEFIIVFFAIFAWKTSKRIADNIKRGLVNTIFLPASGLLVIVLIYLGFINTGSLKGVLSTARPFVLVLLASFVAKRRSIPSNFLLYSSLGIITGDVLNNYFLRDIYGGFEKGVYITNVNLIPLFIFITLSYIKEKVGYVVLGNILGLYLFYSSTYRIVLAVVLVATFSSIIYKVYAEGKKRYVLFAVLGILPLWLILSVNVTYYLEMKNYRNYRVIDRTRQVFTSGIEAEENRAYNYANISTEVSNYVIPLGFVTEGADTYGWHKDIPLLYATDTFGLLLGLSISLLLIISGIVTAVKVLFWGQFYSDTVVLSALFYPCFIVFFVLNGRFILIPYGEALFFGTMVGAWTDAVFGCPEKR